MSVGEESVLRQVLDDSVQNLCISHLEIDRYQRLARGEAASEVESFLSASVELAVGPGGRAQLFAYCMSAAEPSRFRRCHNCRVGREAGCKAAATAFRVAILLQVFAHC